MQNIAEDAAGAIRRRGGGARAPRPGPAHGPGSRAHDAATTLPARSARTYQGTFLLNFTYDKIKGFFLFNCFS